MRGLRQGPIKLIFAYLMASAVIATSFVLQIELPRSASILDMPDVGDMVSVIVFLFVVVAFVASVAAWPLIAIAVKRSERGLLMHVLAGVAVCLWVALFVDYASNFLPAPPEGDEIYDADHTVLVLGMTGTELFLLFKVLVSGFLGGLTYWAMAGRHSGDWKPSV